MKKKTGIIFLILTLAFVIGITGCGKNDKDMIADDNDTKTEQEKEGDSSNLNQGVIGPEDEGVTGDATDAGKVDLDEDGKTVKDEIKDGVDAAKDKEKES